MNLSHLTWFSTLASLLLSVPLSLGFAPTPSSKPDKSPADDREAIQGKWRLVTFALGDNEMKDLDSTWTFTKTHLVTDGKKYTYSLDPKKSPKQINFESAATADRPKESTIGIYELKGDELKISSIKADKPRPKKLEISRNHDFVAMQRHKDKKE